MMKKSILTAVLGLFSLNVTTQDAPKEERFVFTTVKENPITSIENQNRFSTYWSSSDPDFLENKLLRMDKGEYDPSGMFAVHHTMVDRAQSYVCYHGDNSFSPGGSFYDITFCLKNYGLILQEAIPSIMYSDTLPVHNELDAVAGAYTDAIAKGRLAKLSPVWRNGLSATYDTYLDKCPEKFTYKGKEYVPKTFGESLGVNPDDYVSLTFYTHHPFYTQFAIEIQDNWRNGLSWNPPIDELMVVMDSAVKKGCTLVWGNDVSEREFTRGGIAVIPDAARGAELTSSDMARWMGLTAVDKHKELTSKPLPEVNVTQEMRQATFDNWEATGNHGMIIYETAKDQNGKEYFMIENSWGLDGKCKSVWYASKAFVAHKAMNILVHKDALPKDITRKLGFK